MALKETRAEFRKWYVAAAGAITLVVSLILEHQTTILEFVPDKYLAIVQAVIAILTAVFVRQVPQLPNAEIRAAVRQSGGVVALPGGLSPATVVPVNQVGSAHIPVTPSIEAVAREARQSQKTRGANPRNR